MWYSEINSEKNKREYRTTNPLKGGHLCPDEYVWDDAQYWRIDLPQNFGYSRVGHFIYDKNEQTKLLYQNKPCIHTDARFQSIRSDGLAKQDAPLTHFKAILRSMKNLKRGQAIRIESNYYIPDDPSIDLGYMYVPGRDHKQFTDFKYNTPALKANFTDGDDKARNLVELLRKKNFAVFVHTKNPGYLAGVDEGQIAIAYGQTKMGTDIMVGFSTHRNNFRGYTAGQANILYDSYENFDKWSRCFEIAKSSPNDEIIEILNLAFVEKDIIREIKLKELLNEM